MIVISDSDSAWSGFSLATVFRSCKFLWPSDPSMSAEVGPDRMCRICEQVFGATDKDRSGALQQLSALVT